ncbi:hypothetical protein Nepgr_021139 [Nepenthes gracilis]|uniref:Uncharacterized protein n=1 Tax=Nepenthes gracilis TaxID=150966 RepID=A0AAD3SXL9_NEPGR|nr:hypothetical protein Nepgr_021139 [Nepenthes gracilis]
MQQRVGNGRGGERVVALLARLEISTFEGLIETQSRSGRIGISIWWFLLSGFLQRNRAKCGPHLLPPWETGEEWEPHSEGVEVSPTLLAASRRRPRALVIRDPSDRAAKWQEVSFDSSSGDDRGTDEGHKVAGPKMTGVDTTVRAEEVVEVHYLESSEPRALEAIKEAGTMKPTEEPCLKSLEPEV